MIHGLQLLHEGTIVAVNRLSCSTACGISVIQSGMEPTSPALQHRFLTTELPGKPLKHAFTEALLYLLFSHGQKVLVESLESPRVGHDWSSWAQTARNGSASLQLAPFQKAFSDHLWQPTGHIHLAFPSHTLFFFPPYPLEPLTHHLSQAT